MKLAIQGIPGSFSEAAAAAWLAETGRTAEIVPAENSEGIFTAIEAGRADLGISAIFNHSGGIVDEMLRAMAPRRFSFVGKTKILIAQNLLVPWGMKISEIKKVFSHPMALAQSDRWLRENLPDAELVETDDTAAAARDLAAGKFPPGSVAVASARAAEIFGLEILAPGIQNLRDNFTHFVVVGPAA